MNVRKVWYLDADDFDEPIDDFLQRFGLSDNESNGHAFWLYMEKIEQKSPEHYQKLLDLGVTPEDKILIRIWW